MLKKNDLAKQFELVVQQEIKNYQDSLNFVLQSINEIKLSIKNLQSEMLSRAASNNSFLVNLNNRLQGVVDTVFNLDAIGKKNFNDQYIINERNSQEVKDLEASVLFKLRMNDDIGSKLNTFLYQVDQLKSKVDKRNDEIDKSLDHLLMRFRKEILKAKQEIMDSPSQFDLSIAQLESRINSHCVDVKGVMRELNIYKKENSITQKKIENIYTLIARLKKSEEPL